MWKGFTSNIFNESRRSVDGVQIFPSAVLLLKAWQQPASLSSSEWSYIAEFSVLLEWGFHSVRKFSLNLMACWRIFSPFESSFGLIKVVYFSSSVCCRQFWNVSSFFSVTFIESVLLPPHVCLSAVSAESLLHCAGNFDLWPLISVSSLDFVSV